MPGQYKKSIQYHQILYNYVKPLLIQSGEKGRSLPSAIKEILEKKTIKSSSGQTRVQYLHSNAWTNREIK